MVRGNRPRVNKREETRSVIFNQSSPLWLCLMVALLKDVRAAWAALAEAPLRQDNEWLGVPGSRSNFQIFPESTRIVCLLRCHCARWSARTNEQVQTPRDFSGQAESREHQSRVPSSQKQPS